MDRLEIVDISTLPRGKPLETPLCKKRIRAWNPKVQSVARSPKTPAPPVDDDVAPDTDSHVPPVARTPYQNTPLSIAPSFSQLEIVHISTLPRGKPLETPLCKKRIRAWNPNVQSVARSPKTKDTTADDDVAPDTDSHVPPVARVPCQNTPLPIAPSFSQLEIVDISILPRGKPLETPLCKKRIRAWNPNVQSVARSPKIRDTTADDDVAPDTGSHVPPVARAPCQNTPLSIAPSFSQLEIFDILSLLRGKPLQVPYIHIVKKRKHAWNPVVQSVGRSPKTPDPPADDDSVPATDSSLHPEASSFTPKETPPSTARNTCQIVKSVGRATKKTVTPVVGDATSGTNYCLPPAAGFSRRRLNRPIHKLEIVHISTLSRGKSLETPLRKNRILGWSPKVQSVARSPKTPAPPLDDDVAPDTDSSLPTVVSFSLHKNTLLSLAPNTCKKGTRRRKRRL